MMFECGDPVSPLNFLVRIIEPQFLKSGDVNAVLISEREFAKHPKANNQLADHSINSFDATGRSK